MTDFNFTSPQAVSRALGAAGFKRSERHTTRVRGYHHRTAGYRATANNGTDVVVTFETLLNVHTPEHKARTTEKITAMAEALTAAGYVVNVDKRSTTVLVLGKAV